MRNRRKIRMLREKKKQLSRFLPLPFRASYPLGWICSLPFRASYPSPSPAHVHAESIFRASYPLGSAPFALPTP
jgi:hypothetical protein